MDRSDGTLEIWNEAQAATTGRPQTEPRGRIANTGEITRATGTSPPVLAPIPPFHFDIAKMAAPVSASSASASPLTARTFGGSTATSSGANPKSSTFRAALTYAGYAAGIWLIGVLALIAVYRFADPPFSMRMAGQWLVGQTIEYHAVPIGAVSPHVVRAVLLSEDGRFCEHSGVDFDAMQEAIDRAKDGIPRGASTISMQLTKNLFLWNSKSYLRKVIEIPLTFVIEAVWPKRRIMEVYLNIAEWGPGIFGVEAASHYHFNKPAVALSEREAAQLAVTLPNPIRRDAGDPGPQTRRLAGDIQARVRAASAGATRCVETKVRSADRR